MPGYRPRRVINAMRYTTLISTTELAPRLDDQDWVIFDCRFDLANVKAGRRLYNAGHIPGARYVHLDEDLSSPVTEQSGRHPLPDPQQLANKLGDWGVGPSTQVVVYDNGPGAYAARMWWLLRWLGHTQVALLEGGFAAWCDAKQPTTTELPRISPKQFTLRLNNDLVVTADDVERVRNDKDYCVIDARAPERFHGEVEPIDKIAGHIPGSINMPWENNLQADKSFKSTSGLLRLFAQKIGKVTPQNVIHSCGSGVTACHNLLAMEHAGLTGSKLYAGSWSEWIAVPGRAVEKT